MKKIALFLITIITFVSCGDDVQFNSPAFQGNKDYSLWRAEFYNASIDADGYLSITAGNNIETVVLTIPSVAIGTYTLGDVASMQAKFIDANGVEYSTANTPDPSVSVYPEYGEISLDAIENNTFTGTFHFLAFDASGLNSVGFNEGIFYQVPLLSGSIPAVVYTCDNAETDVDAARLAYEATFASTLDYIVPALYVNACDLYREALENKKEYCGDVSGDIQQAINALNECVFPCDLASQNRNTAQAAYDAATLGTYIAACENYQFYLEEQIVYCGDATGTIQAVIDDLNCADDDNDGVPNVYEDFNGDGDLSNDDVDLDGIANYLDNDDDGDGVFTIFEAQDADGNPLDTDGDGDVDYLDNDDDGDGMLTINEAADPNNDGNPADATDTDGDGVPDYLDNM